MAFKMKEWSAFKQVETESDDDDAIKQDKWKRRQDLIKQYTNSGLSRKKAREIALRSIPKKWGKHKGSW